MLPTQYDRYKCFFKPLDILPNRPTLILTKTIHKQWRRNRGGPGGTGPPLFCLAVSNENNMKNIEITNRLIFKKHVAFLTSRLPMILCP